MAWRVVVQPNGKYARFSDIVDDFTNYDADREGMVALCIEEDHMHPFDAEQKVLRAEQDLGRFAKELSTIEIIHGKRRRDHREDLLSQV